MYKFYIQKAKLFDLIILIKNFSMDLQKVSSIFDRAQPTFFYNIILFFGFYNFY